MKLAVSVAALCIAAWPAIAQTAMTRSQLESFINSNIKANGVGAITGPVMNTQLNNIAASMATLLDPNTFSQPQTIPSPIITGFSANLPLIGGGAGAVTSGTRSGSTTEFATVSGALISGHCPSIDGSGNFIDSGAACGGGGGGSGTVSAGSAGNLGYYSTSGTVISPLTVGSGVLTALGVNVGSAGGPVLLNGAGGTPSSLTLTNATGLPNAGLLNSSLTIGSTSVALGATATTLAGLTSVTSTTFVGALTGHASLDLPLAGGALTGAVTQILGSGTGIYTADSSQFLSQNTSTTALTIYRSVTPSTFNFFDVNRSVMVLNTGTTVQNSDAYGSYVKNAVAEGTTPNQANAVGYFGIGVSGITGASTWGANLAWNDGGFISTGVGIELDFTTSIAGDTIVANDAILQGNFAPSGSSGYDCAVAGGTVQWSNCVLTGDGSSAIAINLGALSKTAVVSGPSQGILFNAWNATPIKYQGEIQLTGDAFALTDSEETCGLGMFLAAANVTIQPINCSGSLTLSASSIVVGASQFTANGSVATALSSIGPTGSHTTVQEWLTIKDSSGNTRYIPAF